MSWKDLLSLEDWPPALRWGCLAFLVIGFCATVAVYTGLEIRSGMKPEAAPAPKQTIEGYHTKWTPSMQDMATLKEHSPMKPVDYSVKSVHGDKIVVTDLNNKEFTLDLSKLKPDPATALKPVQSRVLRGPGPFMLIINLDGEDVMTMIPKITAGSLISGRKISHTFTSGDWQVLYPCRPTMDAWVKQAGLPPRQRAKKSGTAQLDAR